MRQKHLTDLRVGGKKTGRLSGFLAVSSVEAIIFVANLFYVVTALLHTMPPVAKHNLSKTHLLLAVSA